MSNDTSDRASCRKRPPFSGIWDRQGPLAAWQVWSPILVASQPAEPIFPMWTLFQFQFYSKVGVSQLQTLAGALYCWPITNRVGIGGWLGTGTSE